MVYKSKSLLLAAIRKANMLFKGTGIGRFYAVLSIQRYLLQLSQTNRSPIVDIEGSKMYMNTEGLPKSFRTAFAAYLVSAGWEKTTTQLFKKVVKTGDIVADLGANIGYFSLLAARLVGNKGKVYSFEPEPKNYSLLLKNIKLNAYDNIVPIPKAVSDKCGIVRLFLHSKYIGAHTIYQPQIGDKGFSDYIEVETITLDEFFKNKEYHVDIIKADIEGAEMAALLGMDQIIQKNKNLKMFLEFNPQAIRRKGDSPLEFVRRLKENYQFSIMAIDSKRYLKINTIEKLVNMSHGQTINLFLEKEECYRHAEYFA